MRRMRAASEVKRGDLEAAPVRDEEGNVIGCERVGFLLTVGVVAERAYPGGIRHLRASGFVCHRGCCVVAAVRSGLNHPAGRVAASIGGGHPGVIRLRERKAIHTHGFCGDVTSRQGVVALAFRSNMILYPLR